MLKKITDLDYVYCLSYEKFKEQCPNCNRNITLYEKLDIPFFWTDLVLSQAKKCPKFIKYKA